MSLLGMLGGLVEAEIRFVVVGGVAARAHGSTRITEDLDVCYDASPTNVSKLIGVLTEWDAYLRGVEGGLPFILDERTFATTPLLTLATSQGALDLIDTIPGVGDYEEAFNASVEVTARNIRFRILSLNALIASKRATGRPRDVDHLTELLALRKLRDG